MTGDGVAAGLNRLPQPRQARSPAIAFIDTGAGSPYAAHLVNRAGEPALLLYGQLLPGPPDGSGFAKIGLTL
jgi:hypothetical protein